ncbi:hypothetical protein Agabi119p4_882 [Agaricus bisporus var. burnettii]|uniref:Uncharacterized protein n=1 Tax=Agaricus bisporus var. burnettii TaxID=192524 RepID=A0A8H7FBD9_AGABI|nr:hypothetical protein Agabi119p4_882 [Agaricus bisporus var. burnettii]
MSPIVSPAASPPSLGRQLSTSSIHSLASLFASASSSMTSLRLPDVDESSVTLEGLRHVPLSLQAKCHKTPAFASDLFEILRLLHVPHFHSNGISPQDLHIHKVSGALTNAVFFVSFPSGKQNSTHFTSCPPDITWGLAGWIGACMAELHSVDINVVEGKNWIIGVEQNVRAWLTPAGKVLALPSLSEDIRHELDLDKFRHDWDRYSHWLAKVDDVHSGSKRVFAHNDTQYGNLLRLNHPKEDADDHRQIIVVDFEYAAPNPASFDIANHFHEWTADYHSPDKSHLLDPSKYPTLAERRNFYLSYLRHASHITGSDVELESTIAKLDRQVQVWSPASHAHWMIWAIVQARDDLENNNTTPEFDYIGYARCRSALFQCELEQLDVPL